MIIIEGKTSERWRVVFTESDKWRVGLYKPEFRRLDEVSMLEKHDAPELFYLISGDITLVLSQDGEEIREVKMEPGKIYIVDEWHNAYSPSGDGVALVVERADIKTEFTELKRR